MPLIEVDNIVKRYGERTVVDEVSFSIERGEIFAIVGPNGAGKTTTVECVAGLRIPDHGRIEVAGLDPRRQRDELREMLGVQLQQSRLPDRLQVREALELFASFYRRPADVDDTIERLGLGEVADVRFSKLSGGQQQRLSVALALIGTPEIAVLDELTTGLDPLARRETWDIIEQTRRDGVTVILVTHFMDEVERLSDRIAVLDKGRVVAVDTAAGIVTRSGGNQQLRFVPSSPIDPAALKTVDHVIDVASDGRAVLVSGTEGVLQSTATALSAMGVIAEGLRLEESGFEEAYLRLTSATPSDIQDAA